MPVMERPQQDDDSSYARAIRILQEAGPGRSIGRVPEFDDRRYCGKLRRRMNRVGRMAVTAAGEALAEAGLLDAEPAPDRAGVAMGTSWGSGHDALAFMRNKAERGGALVNPALLPPSVPNAPGAFVSLRFGLRGHGLTCTSHQACGELALCAAADALVLERADRMVTGGVTEVIDFMVMALNRFRVVAPVGDQPVPFATPRGRGHLSLGEGAGVLVLEGEDAAHARQATPLARLTGWAQIAGPTSPHAFPAADGGLLASAIAEALAHAGIGPGDVDAVVTGASGLSAQDRAIATGLVETFGGRGQVPPICAPVAVTGFFYGAGALLTLAAISVLRSGTVPVTPGVGGASRDLLAALPEAPVTLPRCRNVLSVQCAEGGVATALLLSAL